MHRLNLGNHYGFTIATFVYNVTFISLSIEYERRHTELLLPLHVQFGTFSFDAVVFCFSCFVLRCIVLHQQARFIVTQPAHCFVSLRCVGWLRVGCWTRLPRLKKKIFWMDDEIYYYE